MKYIGYMIGFTFLLLGALSFSLVGQTELYQQQPFTAQYTTPSLFWITGWIIFFRNSYPYKISIISWIGFFILFFSIYWASSDIEIYYSSTDNQPKLSFLITFFISILLFIYDFKHK